MSTPYFPSLLIGGKNIEFLHLEPFTLQVQSKKAQKTLRIRVTYSTHCFSETFGKISHPPGDPVIDRDTKHPRTFCPTRYRLSRRLPDLIRSLPDANVYQTSAMRNWVYSITIDDPSGPYHMFFEIKRASPEQRTWQDLNLVIESAYPQGTAPPPAVRGNKPFVLVCGETYTANPRPSKKKRRHR